MQSTETLITNSGEETGAIGEDLAEMVKNGGIICLYGNLGSGKTTFTQGLAQGLGIEKHVNSPTFLIMRTYQVSENSPQQSVRNFYHVDLYRLESEAEIADIGLVDIMGDPENIVIIEWSEKLKALLPKKRIDIRFSYIDEEKRGIIITHHE